METGKEIVERFIKDNGINLDGSGSGLNGNCVILAGFICHVLDKYDDPTTTDVNYIVDNLTLSDDARKELKKVFSYAYVNSYEKFWEDDSIKEEFTF